MLRKGLSVKHTIFIVIIAILVIINFIGDRSDVCLVRYYGRPTITHEYEVLEKNSIDQIVSDDLYVYILYGEHCGNVQVFDLDGSYQYSAYFYEHLNGAFSIAVKDGVLYVQDCQHNLYQLKDGQFVSFTKREDAEELLNRIDFSQQSKHYFVKYGSVYRIEDNKEACIIKRPMFSSIYQGNFLFVITILILLGIGLVKQRGRTDS